MEYINKLDAVIHLYSKFRQLGFDIDSISISKKMKHFCSSEIWPDYLYSKRVDTEDLDDEWITIHSEVGSISFRYLDQEVYYEIVQNYESDISVPCPICDKLSDKVICPYCKGQKIFYFNRKMSTIKEVKVNFAIETQCEYPFVPGNIYSKYRHVCSNFYISNLFSKREYAEKYLIHIRQKEDADFNPRLKDIAEGRYRNY